MEPRNHLKIIDFKDIDLKNLDKLKEIYNEHPESLNIRMRCIITYMCLTLNLDLSEKIKNWGTFYQENDENNNNQTTHPRKTVTDYLLDNFLKPLLNNKEWNKLKEHYDALLKSFEYFSIEIKDNAEFPRLDKSVNIYGVMAEKYMTPINRENLERMTVSELYEESLRIYKEDLTNLDNKKYDRTELSKNQMITKAIIDCYMRIIDSNTEDKYKDEDIEFNILNSVINYIYYEIILSLEGSVLYLTNKEKFYQSEMKDVLESKRIDHKNKEQSQTNKKSNTKIITNLLIVCILTIGYTLTIDNLEKIKKRIIRVINKLLEHDHKAIQETKEALKQDINDYFTWHNIYLLLVSKRSRILNQSPPDINALIKLLEKNKAYKDQLINKGNGLARLFMTESAVIEKQLAIIKSKTQNLGLADQISDLISNKRTSKTTTTITTTTATTTTTMTREQADHDYGYIIGLINVRDELSEEVLKKSQALCEVNIGYYAQYLDRCHGDQFPLSYPISRILIGVVNYILFEIQLSSTDSEFGFIDKNQYYKEQMKSYETNIKTFEKLVAKDIPSAIATYLSIIIFNECCADNIETIYYKLKEMIEKLLLKLNDTNFKNIKNHLIEIIDSLYSYYCKYQDINNTYNKILATHPIDEKKLISLSKEIVIVKTKIENYHFLKNWLELLDSRIYLTLVNNSNNKQHISSLRNKLLLVDKTIVFTFHHYIFIQPLQLYEIVKELSCKRNEFLMVISNKNNNSKYIYEFFIQYIKEIPNIIPGQQFNPYNERLTVYDNLKILIDNVLKNNFKDSDVDNQKDKIRENENKFLFIEAILSLNTDCKLNNNITKEFFHDYLINCQLQSLEEIIKEQEEVELKTGKQNKRKIMHFEAYKVKQLSFSSHYNYDQNKIKTTYNKIYQLYKNNNDTKRAHQTITEARNNFPNEIEFIRLKLNDLADEFQGIANFNDSITKIFNNNELDQVKSIDNVQTSKSDRKLDEYKKFEKTYTDICASKKNMISMQNQYKHHAEEFNKCFSKLSIIKCEIENIINNHNNEQQNLHGLNEKVNQYNQLLLKIDKIKQDLQKDKDKLIQAKTDYDQKFTNYSKAKESLTQTLDRTRVITKCENTPQEKSQDEQVIEASISSDEPLQQAKQMPELPKSSNEFNATKKTNQRPKISVSKKDSKNAKRLDQNQEEKLSSNPKPTRRKRVITLSGPVIKKEYKAPPTQSVPNSKVIPINSLPESTEYVPQPTPAERKKQADIEINIKKQKQELGKQIQELLKEKQKLVDAIQQLDEQIHEQTEREKIIREQDETHKQKKEREEKQQIEHENQQLEIIKNKKLIQLKQAIDHFTNKTQEIEQEIKTLDNNNHQYTYKMQDLEKRKNSLLKDIQAYEPKIKQTQADDEIKDLKNTIQKLTNDKEGLVTHQNNLNIATQDNIEKINRLKVEIDKTQKQIEDLKKQYTNTEKEELISRPLQLTLDKNEKLNDVLFNEEDGAITEADFNELIKLLNEFKQQGLKCKIKGSLAIRLAIYLFNHNHIFAKALAVNDVDIECPYDQSYFDINRINQIIQEHRFSRNRIDHDDYINVKKIRNDNEIDFDLTIEKSYIPPTLFLPFHFLHFELIERSEIQAHNKFVYINGHYLKLFIKEGYEDIVKNACQFNDFKISPPEISYKNYSAIIYKYLLKLSSILSENQLQAIISRNFSSTISLNDYYIKKFQSDKASECYSEIRKIFKLGIHDNTQYLLEPFIKSFYFGLLFSLAKNCHASIPDDKLIHLSKQCFNDFMKRIKERSSSTLNENEINAIAYHHHQRLQIEQYNCSLSLFTSSSPSKILPGFTYAVPNNTTSKQNRGM